MSGNQRRKASARRKKLNEYWDLVATKSLLLGPTPSMLYYNAGATLGRLGIGDSSNNRKRYMSVLRRAVGDDACNAHGDIYKWIAKNLSKWPACSQALRISSGTSTPPSPEPGSSPGTASPTNILVLV